MTEKKTCKDLIDSEMKDREDYLASLYKKADDSEDYTEQDEAREEISEMAYGISSIEVTRVIWSGGGPSDFIEIHHTRDGIEKVVYCYQDWFDGASREVGEDSPIWRYAEEILESVYA